MGVEPFLICSSVLAVVAQRLLRKICNYCKESYSPEKWLMNKFRSYLNKAAVDEFVRGRGCRECNHTGYLGRTSIFEMLSVSQKIKSLIGNKASEGTILSQAVKEGMRTLAHAGIEKVAAGITTLEEVATVADVEETTEDISIFDLIQAKYMDVGGRAVSAVASQEC